MSDMNIDEKLMSACIHLKELKDRGCTLSQILRVINRTQNAIQNPSDKWNTAVCPILYAIGVEVLSLNDRGQYELNGHTLTLVYRLISGAGGYIYKDYPKFFDYSPEDRIKIRLSKLNEFQDFIIQYWDSL